MTEIAARLPRPRGRSLRLVLLTAAFGLGLVAAGVLVALRSDRAAPAAAVIHHDRAPRAPRARPALPVAVSLLVSERLAADAARGLDRGLFISSPGGVVATASRVARWRPLIVRATKHEPLRAERRRGARPRRELGPPRRHRRCRRRIGSRADADRRLDREALPASAREHAPQPGADASHRARGCARRVPRRHGSFGAGVRATTQRFSPAKSRAARPFAISRRRAVISAATTSRCRRVPHGDREHAGRRAVVRRRDPVVRAALLRLGARRARRAWRRLASMGDMSRDYYWKVLAAKRVMKLYRHRSTLRSRSRSVSRREEIVCRRSAPPAVPDVAVREPGCNRRSLEAAHPAPHPDRRAQDAHRDRGVLRRPGPQARPLATALSRPSTGDARRAALHRPPRAPDLRLEALAHPHECAPRQPLPARAHARECECRAHVLDPHDGLRLRHRPRVREHAPGGGLPVRARAARSR